MSSTPLLHRSKAEVVVATPPEQQVHTGYQERLPSPADDRKGFFGEALAGTPWKIGDVVRIVTRLLVGGFAVGVCWFGASGSVVFKTQVAWLAGSVLAVVIAASGGFAWVLAGLGTVARERRYVREQIRSLYVSEQVATTGPAAVASLVTGEGMKRFHRPDCDVVRGKNVRPAHVTTTDADLKACGMCMS
jgi:hypothetical protein